MEDAYPYLKLDPMKPFWGVRSVSNVIPFFGCAFQAVDVKDKTRTSALGILAVRSKMGKSSLMIMAWDKWLIAK